jgi:hypothetical protein
MGTEGVTRQMHPFPHVSSSCGPLDSVLVITMALFVILDLEFPRLGLIRVDAADAVLLDVRQSMR